MTMNLTRSPLHAWIIGAAALLAIVAFLLPKPAGAQGYTPGYYTTTSSSTATSSTDAVTGITTTNTQTSTNVPAGAYGSSRGDRNRDYWRGRNSGERTTDLEARYPYDNTNGRNRSDIDAARTGFDDPRNPWDGRYTNDNPSNAVNSNDRVNALRGNESTYRGSNDRYRPGNYGTRRVGRD